MIDQVLVPRHLLMAALNSGDEKAMAQLRRIAASSKSSADWLDKYRRMHRRAQRAESNAWKMRNRLWSLDAVIRNESQRYIRYITTKLRQDQR